MRQFRRGTPEETLKPRQSLRIRKANGKEFELRRLDKRDRAALIKAAWKAFPMPTTKSDLVRVCEEEDL
jgi:hypothetical protein